MAAVVLGNGGGFGQNRAGSKFVDRLSAVRRTANGRSRIFDRKTLRGSAIVRPTKPIPGTLQQGGAPFQTTHWTVLLQAKADSDESRKALSEFSEAYWPPLYTFIRRRGYPSSEAQDLTQSFFAHLLEHETLSRAD